MSTELFSQITSVLPNAKIVYGDWAAWLRECYVQANYSPDPSTKNGAVLLDRRHQVIAATYNRFPGGIKNNSERWEDRKIKYGLVVHAEEGTILSAAADGICTLGSTLVCPFYACQECAKAIITGGVIKVVGHAQLMAKGLQHPNWVDTIVKAFEMLAEAEVECLLYDGLVGSKAYLNGEVFDI